MLFLRLLVDLVIISALKDVKFFSDPECTTPLVPPIHWGEVPQGQSVSFDMYLKNVALVPTTVRATLIGDVSTWGSVSLSPDILTSPIVIAPNEVTKVTLSTTPKVDAALGSNSFILEFTD